jgi:hypothetical protein
MGGLMRIEFNHEAFAELRTTGAGPRQARALAREICAKANQSASTTEPEADEPYYEVQDGSDDERARYRIRATSQRAVRHEAKTQALQKAM